MEDQINKLWEEVKKYFSGDTGHGLEHTQRVYKLCEHIGNKENADIEIVLPAAILHDIARKEQDDSKGKIDHASRGAELAREILKKLGLEDDKIEKIAHCIEAHRFRKELIPQSLEAKIIYDADKLDSIGSIGIARTFYFAASLGAIVHNKDIDVENTKEYSKDDCAYREFLVKLRYIKNKIITNEAKKLAEERHNFMVEFFDRLKKEVEGEL